MKTIDSIPTSKLGRAGKFLKTGAKVGANYMKYYGEKMVNNEKAQEHLDEANAKDIYDGLKSLKGSALKVAQMLSMEEKMLPQAYVEQFSLAQFSVPPLSAALVYKTFKNYFGKSPDELYDEFNPNSVFAASIGQVHEAQYKGEKLAVKIQYPGVAESIKSDLALVLPFAKRMFNIDPKKAKKYIDEVTNKLLEETDYKLELKQSKEMAKACKDIKNLKFPKYYKKLSNERIISMSWMEGMHLSEFNKKDVSQEDKNKIGQALWDFYMYQMFILRKVHADPHPGNFLVSESSELIALDFGCVKEIPLDFHEAYFSLMEKEKLDNPAFFRKQLVKLEILKKTDNSEQIETISNVFHKMISFFTEPFEHETYDFSKAQYFERLSQLIGEFTGSLNREDFEDNRGSEHFLYFNRTFMGLYNLMHTIGPNKIKVNNYLSI